MLTPSGHLSSRLNFCDRSPSVFVSPSARLITMSLLYKFLPNLDVLILVWSLKVVQRSDTKWGTDFHTRYWYSILSDNHITPKHEIYTKTLTAIYLGEILIWSMQNLLAHMSDIEPSRSSCFIVPLWSQPLWELWEIPDIYIYEYIYHNFEMRHLLQ